MSGQPLIVVTGANGFVGRHLVAGLLSSGFRVRGAVRADMPPVSSSPGYEQTAVGDIGPETDWSKAVTDAFAVVHLAARVHIMRDKAANPDDIYDRINVQGTRALAHAAVQSGAQRFVYASTVKVHGSERAKPYSESETPAPKDAYGRSKAKAEAMLMDIPGLHCAALRPPLVYGPGVKGNFLSLLGIVQKSFPLPLSLIRNKRSMLHVENFIEAVRHLLVSDTPLTGPFLLRDGQDLSTPELVAMIAEAMDKKPLLLPVPPTMLQLLGSITGKGGQVRRLTESLCVDDSRLRATGWVPSVDPVQGIAGTVSWFLTQGVQP